MSKKKEIPPIRVVRDSDGRLDLAVPVPLACDEVTKATLKKAGVLLEEAMLINPGIVGVVVAKPEFPKGIVEKQSASFKEGLPIVEVPFKFIQKTIDSFQKTVESEEDMLGNVTFVFRDLESLDSRPTEVGRLFGAAKRKGFVLTALTTAEKVDELMDRYMKDSPGVKLHYVKAQGK